MKKYLFMLAFLAGSFILASCSGSEADEEVYNDPNIMTLRIASPSTTVSSRAKIDDIEAIAPAVIWESTDQISVFGNADHSNHQFTYDKAGNRSNIADFKGTSFESSTYYCMYPYQSDATFDGTNIKATIPTVQKATKGSFDPKAAICGQKADHGTTSVSFKHACSFFQIETQGNCEYIVIEPVAATWYFVGGVSLSLSSAGTPITISDKTGGKQKVKLTADGTEGCTSTFEAGKYLIAFASSTKFPKLKVTVKYSAKDTAISAESSTSGMDFAAGFVYSLGTVPAP